MTHHQEIETLEDLHKKMEVSTNAVLLQFKNALNRPNTTAVACKHGELMSIFLRTPRELIGKLISGSIANTFAENETVEEYITLLSNPEFTLQVGVLENAVIDLISVIDRLSK